MMKHQPIDIIALCVFIAGTIFALVAVAIIWRSRGCWRYSPGFFNGVRGMDVVDRLGRLMGWGAVFVLGACASAPAPQSVATAAVWAVVSPAEFQAGSGLKAAERAALRSAGVGDSDVAAGRVVKLHCGTMSDGWWEALGVLPVGVSAARGTVVHLRVLDVGDNDRLGVNPVLRLSSPPLPSGQLAYRFVPNWRELGRSNNVERVELPPGLQGRYEVVQGSYLVKCRQPE